MDINYYLKIKKVPYRDQTPSQYVKGVICRKNVSNKKLASSFDNPYIMIISPSLELYNDTGEL